MSSVLFIAMAILGPAIIAGYVGGKKDGLKLAVLLTFSSGLFLVMLALFNEDLRFSDAGDDRDYFNASKVEFRSLTDWFDLRRFSYTHEQTGYPLLLSWVYQGVGASLYHYKAVNIVFMMGLVLVWYMIGRSYGDARFAMRNATGIILATPLWYYWLFLLKDMTIVLLQSTFLLALIQLREGRRVARSYALMVASTLLILPFRSMLTIVNVVMIAIDTGLQWLGRQNRASKGGRTAIAASVVVFLLLIASNATVVKVFGIHSELRVISMDAVSESVASTAGVRSMFIGNPVKFAVQFLVGEVVALNPNSWSGFSPELIRAVLMVPWIVFGLPMFLIGVIHLCWGARMRRASALNMSSQVPGGREAAHANTRSTVLLLMVFVVMYAGISWVTGDTTRWRMPSIPPMIAVAVFGWCALPASRRLIVLVGWFLSLSVFTICYYTLIR